jgi:L-lactate dehydrogenase complex protein LldG
MNSRDKILSAVLNNQPPAVNLPEVPMYGFGSADPVATYVQIFRSIGGQAFIVRDTEEVAGQISAQFDLTLRIVSTMPALAFAEQIAGNVDPHSFENVELAIIKGHLGVAENGAVWLTDATMGQRIIPYICQHLAVILDSGDIVPTLHQAYERIGSADYGFGGFIGGPSKTADIEQALVLGAHGPLSMTVFIVDADPRSK